MKSLYKITITIKTNKQLTDAEANAFLQSSQYNSLTAAIAIAVNQFHRGDQNFTAEIEERLQHIDLQLWIDNVNPRARLPRGFVLWSYPLQLAWLKKHQRKDDNSLTKKRLNR